RLYSPCGNSGSGDSAASAGAYPCQPPVECSSSAFATTGKLSSKSFTGASTRNWCGPGFSASRLAGDGFFFLPRPCRGGFLFSPSPLAGKGRGGGEGTCKHLTPHPNPPPQGGRERRKTTSPERERRSNRLGRSLAFPNHHSGRARHAKGGRLSNALRQATAARSGGVSSRRGRTLHSPGHIPRATAPSVRP